jgi:lipopolysaccharide/colanic/teichoic acid biosynthesis glycosyltransferase
MRHREKRAGRVDRTVKRQLDLFVACLAGVLLVPVVFIVAVAI